MGSGGGRPGQGKAVRGVKLFADESWLVEYSPGDESIVITSTDYHAGPLRLDAARWRKLGQAFGDGVLAAAPAAPPPAAPVAVAAAPPAAAPPAPSHGGGTAPPDLREVLGRDGWTVAVSRRAKSAYFECAARPGEPLAVSRRELWRVAKRMGKRGA